MLNLNNVIEIKGRLNYSEQPEEQGEKIGSYLLGIISILICMFIVSMVFIVVPFTILGSMRPIINYIVSDKEFLINTFSIFSIVVLIMVRKVMLFSRKRMFNKSELNDEIIFKIYDTYIIRNTKSINLTVHLKDVQMIVETENLFKLYTAKNNSTIPKKCFEIIKSNSKIGYFEYKNPICIPKRFFDNQSQIVEFKNIIINNIKEECYNF